MSLEVKVIPILDSVYVDTREFDEVPVWEKEIEGEILAGPAPACFLGAWYRKVFSSFDEWLGIEGVITLGEFTPDPKRFNLDGKGRYMDNPSVYMGGKSDEESDCGLGYNLMYLDDNTQEDLKLSSPKLGYRPFWRYIYQDATDHDGNVNRRNVNSWNVANPRNFSTYYFPGDVIRMKVYSPCPNYLQLRIELVKATTNPKYVELRKKYHLPNNAPQTFYSPIFFSKGHGINKAEFKRVNSIDQYGNEGYHAKDTNATVSEAIWHECYLYRRIEGKLYKVPFSDKRQTSMICPNEKAITVKKINSQGAESIIITPGNVRE